MNDIVNKAFLNAVQLHDGQTRKGTKIPYVYHVLQVAEQLALWDIPRDKEPDMWAAAMLHDTVEDCDIDPEQLREEYNTTIAHYVEQLTFDGQVSKAEYLAGYKDKEIEVVVVKLADRFRNTNDFLNSDPKYAKKYWNKAQELTQAGLDRIDEIEKRFGHSTAVKIAEVIKAYNDSFTI